VGALGNEPVYREVEELARDVRIVREGGIREIGLFELAGVFEREKPEGQATREGRGRSEGRERERERGTAPGREERE
jgi:hypothetical protein